MQGGWGIHDFPDDQIKFRFPFGGVIYGPQQAGKTWFMKSLVRHKDVIFDKPPESAIYAYGEYDDDIHEFQENGCIIVNGTPSKDLIASCEKPCLVLLDDLMGSIDKSWLDEMYSKNLHHQNLGTWFNTQDLFDKNGRIMRINSDYIVLMATKNGILQIRNLGIQQFPGELDYFMDAYYKATANPYGYLLIDNSPKTPRELRLRKGIFPEEEKLVYLPKKLKK